jgi:2-polyprenyl-3-methyl-5-hydroxy-6-metoxy-1,4-benzoquinol methylase
VGFFSGHPISQALNGALVGSVASGALGIETPAAPWAYALAIELAQAPRHDAVDLCVVVDVEVLKGEAGFLLVDAAGRPIAEEKRVDQFAGRTCVTLTADPTASQLYIRSGAAGSSSLRLSSIQSWHRGEYDITPIIVDVLPALLRQPGAPALQVIADAMSSTVGHAVAPQEIGKLTCALPTLEVPFDRMWSDADGTIVMRGLAELTGLLGTYDATRMDSRAGYLGRDYYAKFLRQSTIRTYHLIRKLQSLGITTGSILEIGSLMGQFVLPLQYLGYKTTAVDRYSAYDGAFSGYVRHLRAAGVTVVETDREDEQRKIAALGQFDAVISMAVIEHVPHTPKRFLETLMAHVRPDGALVLDTPNIARYWNRKRLAGGRSVHPAIEDQFYASEPFEGHHREYTAAEMIWMLQQVGCRDVRADWFDYNLIQFQQLTSDHIHALLAMTVDPSLADTVLVAGRRNSEAA